MAAVSEDPITLWLKLGALEKLEQVVLDGYGDQLYGKTSRIPQVNKFLRQVPIFQSKIDEIHKAVSTGNLREVQHLIDRKKLAFCRDHLGASPMHKAVLFSQKPIIDYLLDRYPSVVHARDHRGRTPLHYAAVLSDGGEIYKMLLDHGADVKATDVFGNRPEYYMHAQDEMDIQALKAGTDTGKPNVKNIKIKHFQPTGGNQKEIIARSAKPVSTRMQIREMLSNGSLDALEELVLQGHGDRLLGESATNPLVRDFIHMVPIYMERIYEIHRAVARGRLRDVQALLDRKKLALARDPLGATPLHKAVMYGHRDIVEYIAMNFPLSKDTKDLDGRTPLHYAAGLKDNHEIYNLLIAFSANPLVLDYKGKTAEYYLQFHEHLHLEQLLKQSQRANANYMANHANRIKAVASPKRKSPYPTRAALALDFNGNIRPTNGEASDSAEDSEPAKNGHVSFKMPKKTLFRSQPLLPPPKLKRLEINSANIKRWVREEDLEKLEGAVLEGYGEKVALQKSDNAKLQKYISDQVPLLVRKIEAIHIAVSNDDLTELQNQLHETDNMVLAKDHFGMAPIHRAVLMNKPETLAFLIDRFPETVNARDKEGRTALHYAAAMSREPARTLARVLPDPPRADPAQTESAPEILQEAEGKIRAPPNRE
ncbi:tankyrase-1 [Trichonephila inaurata madagascariensis]|uniref:Tankyrase-1 n=1 Tax=Trichonephila inaurata madagascariensis TaxID=2747483 RepID=A0A8X6WV80_9ARAC|nr:tankyrase-1 [Trichonephila inaurata madagascariensis]